LIHQLHISADDALHIYTGWAYDCDFFFIHDAKIVDRLKSASLEGMLIIDLGSDKDRALAKSALNI
jgi:hypothetical protein